MTPEFLALHGLAVKKHAPPEELARIMGLDEGTVVTALEDAVAAGQAVGARGTYMLTPEGRTALDAAYPEQFADLRSDDRLQAAYADFEDVNRDLLRLFTEWQTMDVGGDAVPNDHSDPDYDAAIIDRLGDLHEQAEPVLEDFAQAVHRLGIYRDRLESAYDRILAGEHDYVSGVRLDSYHTVWFELHEDILRILGRIREE